MQRIEYRPLGGIGVVQSVNIHSHTHFCNAPYQSHTWSPPPASSSRNRFLPILIRHRENFSVKLSAGFGLRTLPVGKARVNFAMTIQTMSVQREFTAETRSTPRRGRRKNLCDLCGREKKSKFGDMSRSRMSAVSQ